MRCKGLSYLPPLTFLIRSAFTWPHALYSWALGQEEGPFAQSFCTIGLLRLLPSSSRVSEMCAQAHRCCPSEKLSRVKPVCQFLSSLPASLIPLHKRNEYVFKAELSRGIPRPPFPTISRSICLRPCRPSGEPLSNPLHFQMCIRAGGSRCLQNPCSQPTSQGLRYLESADI